MAESTRSRNAPRFGAESAETRARQAGSQDGVPTVLDVAVAERRFVSADGTVLPAVTDLHFSLPADSFTCIVGPSGCGKTTTLRMVLGLDTGFEGSVRLNVDGRVAAVFQEPRLLPWRTVEQNVLLALPSMRVTPALSTLFDLLGLSELRGFFPSELSLGLARRVALARAFALEPALLVLDEPFVSLDEPTAVRLRLLLLDVWQARPTTALMVTHNVREAALLADRILVFSSRPATLDDTLELDVPRAQRDEAFVTSVAERLRPFVSSSEAGSAG